MAIAYDHVALCATDMDRGIAFYRDVVGLEFIRRRPTADGREQATFRVGPSLLVLFHSPRYGKKDIARRSGTHHIAFCLDTDTYDALLARLREEGVEILRQEHNYGVWGKGYATYFRDPDGNELEIKKYEHDPEFRVGGPTPGEGGGTYVP